MPFYSQCSLLSTKAKENFHKHPGKERDPITKAKWAALNTGLMVVCVMVVLWQTRGAH